MTTPEQVTIARRSKRCPGCRRMTRHAESVLSYLRGAWHSWHPACHAAHLEQLEALSTMEEPERVCRCDSIPWTGAPSGDGWLYCGGCKGRVGAGLAGASRARTTMTREQALAYVREHCTGTDDDERADDDLRAAFAACYERDADEQDEAEGLWSHLCAYATSWRGWGCES